MRKKAPEFATRIAPIYAILNWQWWVNLVPTREVLLEKLLEHIDKLGNKTISSASGGLEVRIEEDKSLGGYLAGVMRMKLEEHCYEDEENKEE